MAAMLDTQYCVEQLLVTKLLGPLLWLRGRTERPYWNEESHDCHITHTQSQLLAFVAL